MKASSAARSDGGQELTVEITVRVRVSGTMKKEKKKKPMMCLEGLVWFFFKNVKWGFEDVCVALCCVVHVLCNMLSVCFCEREGEREWEMRKMSLFKYMILD